jgi:uncharacterized protein (TIGR02117 family)
VLAMLSFIVLWSVCAFLLPYIPAGYLPIQKNKTITVFVQSNGVHTDFVMPAKSDLCDWTAFLPYSDFEVAGPAFEYIAVGWGDKGFFIGTPTWADLRFSTAFNASFGLSSTAMHVSYKRFQPKENDMCKAVPLAPFQYRALVSYIKNSFLKKDGKFMLIRHPGYTSHDSFYEAVGTYSLFNTCNVWTGNGLRCTGEKTGVWTPLPGGVLQNLK